MIRDAESHAEEAHKLRELADARNKAETLAYQTEKTLEEHRDKLDEAEASTIEGADRWSCGSALESTTWTRSRRRPRRSSEASHKLAEAVYAQAQRAGAPPAPADGDGAPADDEVVEDADYEVVDEERRRDVVTTDDASQSHGEVERGRSRGSEVELARGAARSARGRARRVPRRPAARSRPTSTTTASGSRATRRRSSRAPTSGS